MTDFKVGDAVRVSNKDMGYYGKTGVVVDVNASGVWPIKVKLDNGKGGTPMYRASELELLKPEPKFKVGDWVKVHGRHDRWDGTVGTVQKISSKSYSHYGNLYTIHKNDVGDEKFGVASENVLNFFEGALEATESPKLKKGDWAKAVGYGLAGGSFEGRAGEVTGVHHTASGVLITLKYPFEAGKAAQGTFDSEYIQVAEAPKPSFQVGTFVTFAEPMNDHWQGGKAEVIEGNGTGTGRYTTRVRIIKGPPLNSLYHDNEGHELNFDPAHLKLWEPKFKKGDAVTVITGTGLGMAGKTGMVTGKDSGLPAWPIEVSFGKVSHGYAEAELLKPVKQEFSVPLYNYAAFDAALTSNLLSTAVATGYSKDKPEAVKHPAHYGGDTTYEVIKVAEAWGLDKDAYLFNVLKYIARAGKKGSRLEDLKKGGFYLNRRIKQEEAK